MTPSHRLVVAILIAALWGCASNSKRRPPPPPGQGPAAAPYPYAAPPQQAGPPPPAGAPPNAGPAPPPAGPVASPGADPINRIDLMWLRQSARGILAELVAALPADRRRLVEQIPFVFDDQPGQVNAFAACIDGKPLMAITDGMLDISAHLARAQATDEVFRTSKVDEYIGFLARNQRKDGPLIRPPPGFFHPPHDADRRKIDRQHQVLQEQLAFVLAHELAHHHLGHLPCTGNSGPLGGRDVARALSMAVPLFNQPNELAADAAGTYNVLGAGKRRQGYQWTEAGGLLTMRFFSGIDQLTPVDILFGFERTHPPPAVRVPVVHQSANAFRMTGGTWLQIPGLG